MAFTLPQLPYAPNALEPHISARTFEFHHGKHHKAYVDTTNSLIAGTPLESADLVSVVRAATAEARSYRAEGWVDHGLDKIERMKPIADKHGLTLIQFAAIWNLSQPAVESVVPTFIQEAGEGVRSIEEQIQDFAALPDVRLSAEESEFVRHAGDNTGCMMLKGASKRHQVSERPDEWPMREDLRELAVRHGLGAEW